MSARTEWLIANSFAVAAAVILLSFVVLGRWG